MKGVLLFVVLTLSINSYAQLRTVLMEKDELSNNILKEGEIFYDSIDKLIYIFQGGNSRVLNLTTENLPIVYSDNSFTNSIAVGQGRVFIGGRVYQNTSKINCLSSYEGAGGYEGEYPPDTGYWYSLYLIPDNRAGYEGKYNCIMSSSSQGLSVNFPEWKRIATFKLGYSFLSHSGKTILRAFQSHTLSVAPSAPEFTFVTIWQAMPVTAVSVKYDVVCSVSTSAVRVSFHDDPDLFSIDCENAEYFGKDMIAPVPESQKIGTMNFGGSSVNVTIYVKEFQEDVLNSL